MGPLILNHCGHWEHQSVQLQGGQQRPQEGNAGVKLSTFPKRPASQGGATLVEEETL